MNHHNIKLNMYKTPGDCLMMYNPENVEHHDDSSDFEQPHSLCIPLVAPKKGNHRLLKHKLTNKTRKTLLEEKNMPNLQIDCDEYPVKLKTNHNKVNMNSGDRAELKPIKSKLSVMKHKLIPCISNIFKRSHNCTKKHMSVIEENRVEIPIDNCCQRCSDCERRRIRKLYKSQNYAVQPVYAIEGNAHKTPASFGPTKITDAPLQNHNRKKSKNQYSSCSLSSSSESELQTAQERQRKIKLFRSRLKMEILKEHNRYKQKQFKHQNVQYPSKDNKIPYHIFSTPYQSRTNIIPESNYRTLDEIPASSSSFWDFLYDKMSKKYQTLRLDMPKPCKCSSSSSSQIPCSPKNCQNMQEPKSEPVTNSGCKGQNQNTPGNTCSCKTSSKPKEQVKAGSCCKTKSSESSSETQTQSTKKTGMDKKIQCKCKDKKKLPDPMKSQKLPSQGADVKSCQQGHDEITASLAQKYNGEILCIHNPPCILINGCLNLPQQKGQQQLNLWPVSEAKKSTFNKKNKKIYQEQSCQYHVPYIEISQYAPKDTQEKMVQSVCPHNPPCEVVRGCCKAKYDPHLQNSCVHVPMCKKVPQCVAGNEMTNNSVSSCAHRPKCRNIPLCSRNYVVLTARGDIGTQVKPSCVCRHVPPCILIPKCLGRAICDTCVPVDAIPDCAHEPSCDLIPACCRKCKEMVSVSSQYPNSCRIV